MFMVVVFMVIVFLLTLTSCGSSDSGVSNEGNTYSPEWNMDEDLENDFWVAVKKLEDHGLNTLKLTEENIDLVFVDEFSGGDPDEKTVAMAKHRWRNSISIEVLRDKWTVSKTKEEQDANILVLIHEIGHDYLNLDHVEGDWDIMNAIGDPNIKISERQITNSINRMLYEGRKIYDSLSLQKRF